MMFLILLDKKYVNKNRTFLEQSGHNKVNDGKNLSSLVRAPFASRHR